MTIVSTSGKIRIGFNRDESRRRPIARPPEERRFGDRRALMPIDPVSDGTWIAVNDAGLAVALLNVYDEPAAGRSAGVEGRSLLSRGGIIPSLMHDGSAEAALREIHRIDPARYPPFRLVFVDPGMTGQVQADGTNLYEVHARLSATPQLFTSSGLGDEFVDPPRRKLFHEYFRPGSDGAAQQDAFHRHQWPDRPQFSVCMSRAEARTVSYTIVEIEPPHIAMTYFGESPDLGVPPVTRTLEMHPMNA